MGQIITTQNDAMIALELLCPSVSDPALIPTEMEALLDQAVRAVIWGASTSYDLSTVVMPTVRNGRRYRLIAFDGLGTSSAAAEPSWPAPVSTSGSFPIWSVGRTDPVVGWWRQAIVTDGNITWQEDGADYDSLWDIQRAAFNGWMMKAGRAICAIDINTGKMQLTQSQIYDHCVNMAQRYAPVYIA